MIGNEDDSTECDKLFNDYINKIQNPFVDERETSNAYEKYKTERNRLATNIFKVHEEKYKSIMQQGNERKLWAEINWSGKYKESSRQQIPMQIMYNYFEQLYQPLDINEKNNMKNLHTDMYIPITDDPITSKELYCASSKMKKGGYDFSLEVLALLMLCLSPLLLILFNLLFFVVYPVKFGMSILSTIPKIVESTCKTYSRFSMTEL